MKKTARDWSKIGVDESAYCDTMKKQLVKSYVERFQAGLSSSKKRGRKADTACVNISMAKEKKKAILNRREEAEVHREK